MCRSQGTAQQPKLAPTLINRWREVMMGMDSKKLYQISSHPHLLHFQLSNFPGVEAPVIEWGRVEPFHQPCQKKHFKIYFSGISTARK